MCKVGTHLAMAEYSSSRKELPSRVEFLSDQSSRLLVQEKYCHILWAFLFRVGYAWKLFKSFCVWLKKTKTKVFLFQALSCDLQWAMWASPKPPGSQFIKRRGPKSTFFISLHGKIRYKCASLPLQNDTFYVWSTYMIHYFITIQASVALNTKFAM